MPSHSTKYPLIITTLGRINDATSIRRREISRSAHLVDARRARPATTTTRITCPAHRRRGLRSIRALNPNGRVPMIDDDGFILSESMAINLYLAKKHESPLYPSDPKNEALAWQWSLWETDRLDRQIVNYVQAHHGAARGRAQKGDRRGRMAASARNRSTCWRLRSRNRSGLPARHSRSAISTSPQRFTVRLTIDTTRWPRTQAWLHRCWERPAAKRARAMREGNRPA